MRGQGYQLTEADRHFMAVANQTLHAQAERNRASTLPSLAPPGPDRLHGTAEQWAEWEDRIESSRGRRGRWHIY